MKWTKTEKKQLIIYIAVAYGVTYLMGLLMWHGYASGTNLGVFPNVQMMYPAAGVMLAYLITRKGSESIPKRFYFSYLVITLLLMGCAVLSLTAGGMKWVEGSQYVLVVGSILCGILMLTEKREKRGLYGLHWKKGKASVLCIMLFVVLYLLRTAISLAISGQLWQLGWVATDSKTWIALGLLFVNFFLLFIAFFGEEYGWRYFLQPLLQHRFGKRIGVLLLGVVWGLWHLPVNLFYNGSPKNGLYFVLAQQITCITLGIFFAYVYMKTGNIWVTVILHFLNNNLIPILTGTFSANVLQNQGVSWAGLILALILNGVIFAGFLLSREFRKETRQSTLIP